MPGKAEKQFFPDKIYDEHRKPDSSLSRKIKQIHPKAKVRFNRRDQAWDTFDSRGNIVPEFSQEKEIDGKFVTDLHSARKRAGKKRSQHNKQLQREAKRNAVHNSLGAIQASETVAEFIYDKVVADKKVFGVGIDIKALEAAKKK